MAEKTIEYMAELHAQLEKEKKEREAAEAAKQEAIRVRFMIAAKRDATSTGRLGGLQTHINQLKIRLDENTQWASLKKYCKEHKLDVKQYATPKIGMEMTKLCKKHEIEPKKEDDINYGSVKAYPVELLEEFFSNQ